MQELTNLAAEPVIYELSSQYGPPGTLATPLVLHRAHRQSVMGSLSQGRLRIPSHCQAPGRLLVTVVRIYSIVKHFLSFQIGTRRPGPKAYDVANL